MSVIVDTSVWIEYFRRGIHSTKLDFLIDEDLIVINDLILAELVPFLKLRNQRRILKSLYSIKKMDLDIRWDQIIEFQFRCLKSGMNGIGVPDLMVVQNAKQNDCEIYSLDSHFGLMKDVLGFHLFA
jgi:predicted nucleic acid-binding protein